MSNITISTSAVPVGFCFTSWAESWPNLVGLLTAEADLSVNLSIGESPPVDTAKLWQKTISGVPGRVYKFDSGVWVSEHDAAGRIGSTIIAPEGLLESDVDTWDGGEAGAITKYTGPMWEIDTRFSAKFPIGPGTLPSGTAIVEGVAGGEEKVSLKVTEIPPHAHVVLASQSETGGGNDVSRLRPNVNAADSNVNTANTGGDATGVVTPHQNMPPYLPALFLKKTARTHYRG